MLLIPFMPHIPAQGAPQNHCHVRHPDPCPYSICYSEQYSQGEIIVLAIVIAAGLILLAAFVIYCINRSLK